MADRNELREIFRQTLNENLIQMVLSNTRDAERALKVKVRPVMIKDNLLFQETVFRGTQVFHSNRRAEELLEELTEYMETLFKQAQIKYGAEEITALVGKKGNVTVRRRNPEKKESGPQGLCRPSETRDKTVTETETIRESKTTEKKQTEESKTTEKKQTEESKTTKGEITADRLSHNRTKRYILEDGKPVDFLVGLGVQSADGRVSKAHYDKFRQINRYLEFIEDVIDELPEDRTLRIVDFGCGKSYLTFAMYYYLHQLQKRDIFVTGLDLKKEVIENCNALAEKLKYDRLRFEVGDIQGYHGAERVDMVVSHHACDKATDYALEKAVKWGAKVIMAVPCCQHELNGQIRCDVLRPILRYGIIKERMAALITDALRADILEQNGYDTQILEFIDLEHTPKNLLIRAVKSDKMRSAGRISAEETMEFLQVHPTLKELL